MNSGAVMPPQRLRRAGTVVMRDDFNGDINRNYWDYEVSMYGGYVSPLSPRTFLNVWEAIIAILVYHFPKKSFWAPSTSINL